MISSKLTIVGKVQGVGFRAFASAVAEQMGITGTVRNMPNGAVEIFGEFEDEGKMEKFISRIKAGQGEIEVRQVQISKKKRAQARSFNSFTIARG